MAGHLVSNAYPNYSVFQAKGNVQASFVGSLIEKNSKHELTQKEFAWLAGTLLCVIYL